jgi:hypothetical protein
MAPGSAKQSALLLLKINHFHCSRKIPKYLIYLYKLQVNMKSGFWYLVTANNYLAS